MKAFITCILLFAYCNSFAQIQRYDIVIDEIMADPSPVVHLPNAEFIEIKNVSGHTIDLAGCRLGTNTSTSTAFPSYFLPDDSFLIITSNSNASFFNLYGSTIGLSSFPSIVNTGTTLTLLSSNGSIIHAVSYSVDWYHNVSKAKGGWTLEMIDTDQPCTGIGNWKASINENGGTPGKKNSVDSVLGKQSSLQLVRTYSTDSLNIVLLFNRPLDQNEAVKPENYTISNGPAVSSAALSSPVPDKVTIKLAYPLERKKIYSITVHALTDCKGNLIGDHNFANTGLAEEANDRDLVINEILFNPRPNAYDYVELYNRSKDILDISKLFLANRNSSGTISSVHKLSGEPLFIYPAEYIAITIDKASLEKEYLVKYPDQIFEVTSMPSYPNDSGTVVLIKKQNIPIDEVSYSKNWQFPLVSNSEGVAIERLDPEGPSKDPINWHSAASTSGYGTPGYKNSQYKPSEEIAATIYVTPKLFSPNNDGVDDFTSINYQVDETGYLANIYIFDANGRMIRQLVKNDLLGIKGQWAWDGLDANRQKLSAGIYVIYTELFNLQGKKKRFKTTVTKT